MLKYDLSTLPCVSFAGRSKEKSGREHSLGCTNANLLAIIESGRCSLIINETEQVASEGDILLIPKNTRFTLCADGVCEYLLFHFDGELLARDATDEITSAGLADSFNHALASSRAPLCLDYIIKGEGKEHPVYPLSLECIKLYRSFALNDRSLLSLRFSEMLLMISDAYRKSLSGARELPEALVSILSYLDERYTSSIRLEDVCKHACVSKQYCMRLFKRYMNMTINDYILSKRMKHAAQLLLSSSPDINELSSYLGFSSVSYFSRVFKNYFGVAPSQYKG